MPRTNNRERGVRRQADGERAETGRRRRNPTNPPHPGRHPREGFRFFFDKTESRTVTWKHETVYPKGDRTRASDRSLAGPEGVTGVDGFTIPALEELTAQQTRYAPAARCLEQKDRAEKLLAEVEAGRVYPYQYVCYRITE